MAYLDAILDPDFSSSPRVCVCCAEGCGKTFSQHGPGPTRKYCADCLPVHMKEQSRKKDYNRYHRQRITREIRCKCGAPFTPRGRQSRCDECRFAPHPNPLRKLKESDIPVIRARYASGETAGKIARDYGMARSTIYAIVDWQTWRHVS